VDPRLTMQSDPHESISRLESEIETLAESAERCRKIALTARTAIAAGGVLLAAILLGLIRIDGLSLMLAAILLLGGIVVYGSNATTARQIADRIGQAEQSRAELISAMELTLVREPSRLLH
jgi:hypothetical protein